MINHPKLSTAQYHTISEELVEIMKIKTGNPNPTFFRILIAYYFATIASSMRATINTLDRGQVPVNAYVINLAPSGYGKGHSTNIFEENILNPFKDKFMEEIFPAVAEQTLAHLAIKKATKKGIADDVALDQARAEFERLGNYVFTFDSGTTPAVKQMRNKLLMAGAGAINLSIDEVGDNLLGNSEVLSTFLELFDKGLIKQKLTKNTKDSERVEDLSGTTPANLCLFGTPSKLLDGSTVEKEWDSMLESGYARRCIVGLSTKPPMKDKRSAIDIYNEMTDSGKDKLLHDLADHITSLASMHFFGRCLNVTKTTTLEMIEYKQECEIFADTLPEHEFVRKAEITHRYWKALKLAGAYAFIDASLEVTSDHFWSAVKLVEDSGDCFYRLLNRERPYVKLARYIAAQGRELTHVDLAEDLPIFRGSASAKQELITYAIAWGYKNNVIIKQSYADGIALIAGEALKETNLDEMIFSYSTDIATGFSLERRPFSQLHLLTQADGIHWCNHGFLEEHRTEEKAVKGFNLLVLDLDKNVSMPTVKLLMQQYKYHLYTTKRHTDVSHRFRLVLPLSHELQMGASEYKEFMKNIFEMLPFEVDEQTNQRARKWLSHNAHYEYNDGELFDVLPYIPQTSRNENRKKEMASSHNLEKLERWFLNHTGTGNRSNQLIKYALMLVDIGNDIQTVQDKVIALNDKLADKMDTQEIYTTIMKSATKAFFNKQQQGA